MHVSPTQRLTAWPPLALSLSAPATVPTVHGFT